MGSLVHFAVRVALAAALGAVIAPAVAHAQPKPAPTAPAEDKKRAQKKYEEGVEHMKAGQRQQALEAFRASFALVPSPNSLLMAARVQAELGDFGGAYETYENVERTAQAASNPKYRAALESARQEREELKAKIGRLAVHLKGPADGARVTIGGADVPPERLDKPVVVAPGEVTVVATTRDGRRVERRVTVAAAASVDLDVDLTAPAPVAAAPPMASAPGPQAPFSANATPPPADQPQAKRTSLLPYAIVAGAVGVVGFGTFAVAGAMNQSSYDDVRAQCTDRKCPESARDAVDSGRTQQTIANVGVAFGVIGLGTGLTLFLVDLALTPSSSSARAHPKRVTAGVGPGSVSVGGAW